MVTASSTLTKVSMVGGGDYVGIDADNWGWSPTVVAIVGSSGVVHSLLAAEGDWYAVIIAEA